MRRRKRIHLIVSSVVVAGLLGGCSSDPSASQTSDGASTPGGSGSGGGTTSGAVDTGAVGAALSAAGTTIVPINALVAPASSVASVVTDWQAAAWQGQVDAGGGILGSDLRDLLDQQAADVPFDALVAAWLTQSTTPAAKAAAAMVPIADLTDPGEFRYPWAVLALFLDDTLASSAATEGPSRATHPAKTSDGNDCATLQAIYTTSMTAAILALQQRDADLSHWVDAAAFTYATSLPAGVTTPPDAAAVKVAAQILAVVLTLAAAVQPWSIAMIDDPLPTGYTAGGSGNPGGVVARVYPRQLDTWPSVIADCGTVAHEDLPALDPGATPVAWTFIAGNTSTLVGTPAAQLTDGGDAFEARLDYATGNDDVPGADAQTELIEVTAQVQQPSAEVVHDIVDAMVASALADANRVLSGLPITEALLDETTTYFDTFAQESFTDAFSDDTGLNDTTTISIPYHADRVTTTAPISTDSAGGNPLNFCSDPFPMSVSPISFTNIDNITGVTLTIDATNESAVMDWNNSGDLVTVTGDHVQLRGSLESTFVTDGTNYNFSNTVGVLQASLSIGGTEPFNTIGSIGDISKYVGSLGHASCTGYTLTFDGGLVFSR